MDAGSSSNSHHPQLNIVDDQYFSALHDDDEILPISDEKYAQELQLQEALISSLLVMIPNSPNQNASSLTLTAAASSSSSSSKQPLIIISESSIMSQPYNNSFCGICLDTKIPAEMFQNTNVCSHMFCSDCIRGHVASKIKENLTTVSCPDPRCEGVIGPEACRSINVPKEVLERWEQSLCESLIMKSDKVYYCPFEDCSAMLVDDGGEAVTSSECPHCNRLFCAQCKVAWHCGLSCMEFKNGNRRSYDDGDALLSDLAKSSKWMKCSNCKLFVEKVDGCQHISCRCGHHFCYVCGQPYNLGSHVCESV